MTAATTTKRPEGRQVGAVMRRDVSPFPHRRNLSLLSVEGEIVNDEVGPLFAALDDVSFFARETAQGFTLGRGREAVVVKARLAADVVRALHLKPPCSRNGDSQSIPLNGAEVKSLAVSTP